VLAVLAAVYTAYLFAQARARDLWQSPLLPPQLVVQSLLAGGAALLLAAPAVDASAVVPLAWITAGASLAHLLLIAGEVTLTHPTSHARLATWEMTSGTYRAFFWAGVLGMVGGVLAPWLGGAGAVMALAGLLAYEHAYVQAGQAVPLA